MEDVRRESIRPLQSRGSVRPLQSRGSVRAFVKGPPLTDRPGGPPAGLTEDGPIAVFRGERSATMSRAEGAADMATKALYLSTTVANYKPPNTAPTAPSRQAFDPEADYNYDSKTVTPDTYDTDAALLRFRYKKLCESLGVIPASLLMKQIGQSAVTVHDANLTPKELKAALTVLVMDTDLTQLDISGNLFRSPETQHISELLKTNKFLTHLVLANNHLTGEALETLVHSICTAKGLRSLDLSGNGLCDRDSISLCRLIEDSEFISTMILHHNQLGQCGAALGNAIANNDTMTMMDLSWNHIRGPGAVGVAVGLGKNGRLTHVNLAWNGFGFEGCAALGHALKKNSTLQQLDLTNNRVHPPALHGLLSGVCANRTLSSLLLGLNPIPANIATYCLSRIAKWKQGALQRLDLHGLSVDKDFFEVLNKIQEDRMFYVRFDVSLPAFDRRVSKVDPNNIYNIDPMRILFFMKEHLRTIDLFLKIDQNRDGKLSREEMKYAFQLEGYPISEKALDSVMKYLDTNNSGEVDLGEFFKGNRQIKRDQIREAQERDEQRKLELARLGSEMPMEGVAAGVQSPAQTISPQYSQAFRKPPPRQLPKLTK